MRVTQNTGRLLLLERAGLLADKGAERGQERWLCAPAFNSKTIQPAKSDLTENSAIFHP